MPTVNVSGYGPGLDYEEGEASLWEAATDDDHITGDKVSWLEFELRDAETFSSYIDSISMVGGTFDATRFRGLRAKAGHGHDGTPNIGVELYQNSNAVTVSCQNSFAKIQGLILRNDATTAYVAGALTGESMSYEDVIAITDTLTTGAIIFTNNTNSHRLEKVICISTNSGAASNAEGFYFSGTGGTLYASNCMSYFASTAGDTFRGVAGAVVRNCIATGGGNGFVGTWSASSSNNVSEDTSAPGADSLLSTVVTFEDAGSLDFRPVSSQTEIITGGIDLSGDFTTDIVGTDWAGVWGMGPFKISEPSVPSAPVISLPPYRIDPGNPRRRSRITIL